MKEFTAEIAEGAEERWPADFLDDESFLCGDFWCRAIRFDSRLILLPLRSSRPLR